MHTRAPTSLLLGFREPSLRLASPRAAERTRRLAKSASLKSQRVHGGGGRDLNRTTPCKQLKKSKKVGCRGRSHHQPSCKQLRNALSGRCQVQRESRGKYIWERGSNMGVHKPCNRKQAASPPAPRLYPKPNERNKAGWKGSRGHGETRKYLWPGCAAGFITRLHLF